MSICLALTDPDWSVTKDIFSIIGTLVSAGGVIAAFWIGNQGLATWRRQIQGVNSHDLAKKILLEMYNVRQLLRAGRNRNHTMAETEGMPPPSSGLDTRSKAIKSREYAFGVRTRKIHAAVMSLSVSALEAEALWGSAIYPHLKKIDQLAGEICNYLGMYILVKDPDLEGDELEDAKEYFDGLRSIFVSFQKDSSDPFTVEFDECFKQAELYLKSQMLVS